MVVRRSFFGEIQAAQGRWGQQGVLRGQGMPETAWLEYVVDSSRIGDEARDQPVAGRWPKKKPTDSHLRRTLMFLRGTQGTMPNLQLVTAFAVRIALVRPRHYIGVPNRATSVGLGRITFGGCQKNPSWMTTNPRLSQ